MASNQEEENYCLKIKSKICHFRMSTLQRKIVEINVLIFASLIIWSLFLLPVVFFYTHSSQAKNVGNETIITNTTDCSVKYEYEGQYCQEYLMSYAQCLLNDDEIIIYTSRSPEEQLVLEERMSNIILGLDIIEASDGCKSEVYPFLCLYEFGLCGSDVINYQPMISQCENIRDSVCEEEWTRAGELLALTNYPSLPDCTTLGDRGLSCMEGNDSLLTPTNVSIDEPCNITCDSNFYCEENICRPLCAEFTLFSDSYVILSESLLIISGVIGLVCSFVVLYSFWHRRKTLTTFPSILVLYMTISLIFVELIILISFMDPAALLCSSKDLIESLISSTLFCQISGFLETYALLHCTMWWLLNICALFWKIQFPFHSRYYDSTHRTRYIHLGCVIAAILLPLYAPVTIVSRNGYVIPRFPPIVCFPRSADETFYAIILPISVLFALGTTILLLILRKIRQHMGDQSGRNVLFSPAERKVFVVFLYYLFLGVLQLTTFTIIINEADHNREALLEYFACKSSGVGSMCASNVEHTEGWSLFATIILLLFPVINLYFSISFSQSLVKGFCSCGRKSRSPSGTHSTSAPTPKQTTEF